MYRFPEPAGLKFRGKILEEFETMALKLSLNSNNLTGKFKWNTGLNLAFNRNRVTDLGDRDIIDDGSSRFMNVVKKGGTTGRVLRC
jgi:TonB-dependent starch-binding outer membrane protein SusC